MRLDLDRDELKELADAVDEQIREREKIVRCIGGEDKIGEAEFQRQQIRLLGSIQKKITKAFLDGGIQ